MRRRDFLGQGAALGMFAAAVTVPNFLIEDNLPKAKNSRPCLNSTEAFVAPTDKLTPPAKGKIPVAFAISEGVTVIDFAGPWEVFQDVMVPSRGKEMDDQMPFELFTVSEKTEALRGSAGLQLVPDFTFANVPQPKIVVVPAQRGSEALHAWLRQVTEKTDVTM